MRDPAVKAKTSAPARRGYLLRGGEAKRAKATLAGVLASPEAPPDAVLLAATGLREVFERDQGSA